MKLACTLLLFLLPDPMPLAPVTPGAPATPGNSALQVPRAPGLWGPAPQDAAQEAFVQLLQGQGLKLDVERGLLGVPVSVAIKHDLLEYLLVGPEGKGHESLFGTAAKPSLINAALLALGAKPGQNAAWVEPTASEPARLIPPSGDGFYLYVAWRERDEVYLYRIEDVISNVQTGRSMRRHRWVYLGSRFASPRPGEPEVFVADATHNIINLSFFYSGNTLLTAALEECQEQTIWSANSPLLPPTSQNVQLIFSKQRLSALAEDWITQLPRLEPSPPAAGPEREAEDAR